MKIIKKQLFMFVILCAYVFSLSSCTEKWEDSYLEVDKKEISASNDGETVTVSIETNSSWRIVKRNADWITSDKTEGTGNDQLQLTISRNNSNNRTGFVNIVAGTEAAEIKIEQKASTSGRLSVTTGSCTITRSKVGSRYKYTITARYTVSGGHLAKEAGVSINGSDSKTTGTITDGMHTATAYITSSNSNISVSYRAYAVKKNGETVYGATKTQKYNGR